MCGHIRAGNIMLWYLKTAGKGEKTQEQHLRESEVWSGKPLFSGSPCPVADLASPGGTSWGRGAHPEQTAPSCREHTGDHGHQKPSCECPGSAQPCVTCTLLCSTTVCFSLLFSPRPKAPRRARGNSTCSRPRAICVTSSGELNRGCFLKAFSATRSLKSPRARSAGSPGRRRNGRGAYPSP